jgi:hypothetical protein
MSVSRNHDGAHFCPGVCEVHHTSPKKNLAIRAAHAVGGSSEFYPVGPARRDNTVLRYFPTCNEPGIKSS